MHFMNDPNGLVYFNGTYELYYQYNPLQLVAGNQSWGHATSSDLIHWVNADPQIAIPEILSGRRDRFLLGALSSTQAIPRAFLQAIQDRHS